MSTYTNTIVFSPDGKKIAFGSSDSSIQLWDLENNESQIIGKHYGRVYSLIFYSDGQKIASGGWDGTIKLLDSLREGQIIGYHDVISIAFSPDGKKNRFWRMGWYY